jgi:hypothetical protein
MQHPPINSRKAPELPALRHEVGSISGNRLRHPPDAMKAKRCAFNIHI